MAGCQYLNRTITEYNHKVQAVKLFAALLVIISHAFPLSLGTKDFLAVLTVDKFSLGRLAVYIFFFLSGIYTAKSFYQKEMKIRIFIYARIRKLLPTLLLVVLLSVFIIGPIFTTLKVKEYIEHPLTWKYLLNIFFIPQYKLPGVFLENIYNTPPAVNGVLWTLPLEIICYFIAVISIRTKILSKQRKAIFTISEITIFYLIGNFAFMQFSFLQQYLYHLRVMYIFFIGMFVFMYADRILLSWKFTILFLLLIGVSFYFGNIHLTAPILIPYILLNICFNSKNSNNYFSKLGECSYEIYLLGFLIQQCTVACFGGRMEVYINLLICIPCTLLASILLHLFNKKINVINIKKKE